MVDRFRPEYLAPIISRTEREVREMIRSGEIETLPDGQVHREMLYDWLEKENRRLGLLDGLTPAEVEAWRGRGAETVRYQRSLSRIERVLRDAVAEDRFVDRLPFVGPTGAALRPSLAVADFSARSHHRVHRWWYGIVEILTPSMLDVVEGRTVLARRIDGYAACPTCDWVLVAHQEHRDGRQVDLYERARGWEPRRLGGSDEVTACGRPFRVEDLYGAG